MPYSDIYSKQILKKFPTTIFLDKNVTSVDPSNLVDTYNEQYVHDFKVDEENKYFCDINGVLFSKDKKKLIAFPPGRIGDIYCVPRGTLIIGENAFSNSHVTVIKLPKSVITLEKNAFHHSYSYIVDLSISSLHKVINFSFPSSFSTFI